MVRAPSTARSRKRAAAPLLPQPVPVQSAAPDQSGMVRLALDLAVGIPVTAATAWFFLSYAGAL